MSTPEQWLDRVGRPLPKVFEECDYPNHHMAVIRCRSCETAWEAVYPQQANPNRMECYNCRAKDSEVYRYIRFIYPQ